MDVEKSGPTLEGLAQRLEALEHENERLRGQVATLEGAPTRKERPDSIRQREEVAEERVSRKAMLAKAGAAAVAVAAAGTMLTPREAKAATVVGDGNIGVRGIGTTNPSAGVRGEIQAGQTGDGVQGFGKGNGNLGVYGKNLDTQGIGVRGDGAATGVRGNGDTTGVYGGGGYYGVYGGGSLYGVLADGDTTGVRGAGNTTGVVGFSPQGYGGQFDGGKAQLKLTPKSATGRPKSGSHTQGEIYLDSAGTLFVCTKNGTPGTWRKVTTTSA